MASDSAIRKRSSYIYLNKIMTLAIEGNYLALLEYIAQTYDFQHPSARARNSLDVLLKDRQLPAVIKI